MAEKTLGKDYDALAEGAIRQLERENRTVSVANVIAITGGSRRDISPAYRRAKEKLAHEHELQMHAPEMPAEILDLAASLWARAYGTASKDARTIMNVMRRKADEQSKTIDDVEKLLASAELEGESWKRQAEQDAAENERLAAEVERLSSELLIANARLRERDDLVALLAQPPNPSPARPRSDECADAA